MIDKPFQQAVPVLELIEKSGFEAYFVGGSVRDHILGREIADVDIATSALPEELKQIFPKTVDVGIEHGTILVQYKGSSYEITTFRSESGYSDYRRPDKVSFIRSLREDLQRRDFTMNAIAMDKDGKIIDPFAGKDAILQKQIVTVGSPNERFGEDALRMLRAVRFLSQLSFTIERHTLGSLQNLCYLLENIAVERKAVEFEKMLQGPNRGEGIRLLAESGMHQYLPGLKGHREHVIRFSSLIEDNLDLSEAWVLLILTLGLKGKEIENFLRAWKLPIQKIRKLKQIHSWLMHRCDHQWDTESVYKAGMETALSAEKVFGCLNEQDGTMSIIREIHSRLPIRQRTELDVTGNDLMSWLEKMPGPWLRELLEDIERAVINGAVPNEKEKIREWLSESNQKSERN